MTALENIFKNSYGKGDGSIPVHTPEIAALQTSALLAWMLLVSAMPAGSTLMELVDSYAYIYISLFSVGINRLITILSYY